MPLHLKDQIYATVNSDAAYNGSYKLTFPSKAGTIALTSDIPSVPTVNNGQLTIQKNGTNVQTFTANQSSNVTANITVPTKTSDLTNDSGFIDSVAWGDVTDKPTFATVATSGSYNDLSDKPTIPTVGNATLTIQKNGTNVQTFTANATSNKTANITVPTKTSDLTNDSNFVADASYVHTDNNFTTTEKNKLSGIAAGAEVNVQANWTQTTTTADDYIKNKPTLATVATSGSYNDLSNKPTIPTVGNATLTIQKNGTNVQTFTANATSNKTANITVPTKTSDITNDSGFVSTSDVGTVTGTMIADATVGSDKLTNNAVWTANIKDAAVTSGKIDWTTIVGAISDVAFGDGYIDLGTIRIQWMNRQKTGLNTAAGGYNTWTVNWPVPFGSGNYTVVCSPIGDTGNIAGGEFKVYTKSTTAVGFNYNHTGAIGGSTLNYSVIAIGVKPS